MLPFLIALQLSAASPVDIHINSGVLTTVQQPDPLPSFLVCNDSVSTDSCLSVGLNGSEVLSISSGGALRAASVALSGALQLATMVAASAPLPCVEGSMVYLSNVRKPGEAAGAGSGAPCVCTHAGKTGPLVWQSLYGYVSPSI